MQNIIIVLFSLRSQHDRNFDIKKLIYFTFVVLLTCSSDDCYTVGVILIRPDPDQSILICTSRPRLLHFPCPGNAKLLLIYLVFLHQIIVFIQYNNGGGMEVRHPCVRSVPLYYRGQTSTCRPLVDGYLLSLSC